MRARHLACVTVAVAVLAALPGAAAQNAARTNPPPARYPVRGMVMKVAPTRTSVTVSHDSVPTLMEAMTMSFDVRSPKELDGVRPGMIVEFTLVLDRQTAYAEHVQIRPYESAEQDPMTARRLKLLAELTAPPASLVKALATGQPVPDFTLTDHMRRTVTLSQFRGKVVALNFIYTSCALPQFCFRIANNFGVIHKRFAAQAGKDLVLLTVTFDPARDTPERLAEYARQWKVSPDAWRFLTGRVADIKRTCALFDVDFFPEEGLVTHSAHTAVIDRQGKLVANIEGNQFTARQLGDLVETVLRR